MMHTSADSWARALGGHVTKDGKIRAPGPGHSEDDDSLLVEIGEGRPDGFTAHSFAGDDPIRCKDYVRQKVGLPPFEPKTKGNRFTARPQTSWFRPAR